MEWTLVYVIFTYRYFKFSHLLFIFFFLMAQRSFWQFLSESHNDIQNRVQSKLRAFFLLADEITLPSGKQWENKVKIEQFFYLYFFAFVFNLNCGRHQTLYVIIVDYKICILSKILAFGADFMPYSKKIMKTKNNFLHQKKIKINNSVTNIFFLNTSRINCKNIYFHFPSTKFLFNKLK